MIRLARITRNVILVIFISLFTTSCSVFSPVQLASPTKYMLYETPVIKKHRTRQSSILVAPVTAEPLYDTTSMAYMTKPYEINYYVKSEWAELPTVMLKSQITNTLTKSHHYHGVFAQPTYARYNYILNTHILELRQIFSGGRSYYRIALRVDLIHARTSRLIASKEFLISQPIAEHNAFGGVVAANKGMKRMLKHIAAFCLKYT